MFGTPAKTLLITFVIFMLVFTYFGLPVAGFFIWLHFVVFVMPKSWRF